jgi:hypothetical protein
MADSPDMNAEELFFARANAAGRLRQKLIWYVGPERSEEVTMRPVIEALPLRRVKAGNAAVLRVLGFKEGECHVNCMAASAADSSVRHVFGWTIHKDYYVFHSVLQTSSGDYVCITPAHTDALDADGRFEFMEDDQMSCDGVRTCRAGVQITPWWSIIRRTVSKVDGLCTDLEARVRNGELTYDEAMALWNL